MGWDGKVPMRNGSLLNYVTWYDKEGVEWVDGRQPFRATMRFTGFYRGRSAAGGTLEDSNGNTYTIFLADLEPLLVHNGVPKEECEWVCVKRGQNYGVKLNS